MALRLHELASAARGNTDAGSHNLRPTFLTGPSLCTNLPCCVGAKPVRCPPDPAERQGVAEAGHDGVAAVQVDSHRLLT